MIAGSEYPFDFIAFTREELDITDRCLVEQQVKLHSPDAIINAAAYTAVDKAEHDSGRAFDVNQNGPQNLAKAASHADIPIIHISTDYVFDGCSDVPYEVTSEPNPQNVWRI